MRNARRRRGFLWLLAGALLLTPLGIRAEELVLVEELVPEDLLTEGEPLTGEADVLVAAQEEGEPLEEEELTDEVPDYERRLTVDGVVFTASAPGRAFPRGDVSFVVREEPLGGSAFLDALYAAEGRETTLYGKAYTFGFYAETGEEVVPALPVCIMADYGEAPLMEGIPATFENLTWKVYGFEEETGKARVLSSSLRTADGGYGGVEKASFSVSSSLPFAIVASARGEGLYQADGLVWAEEPADAILTEEEALPLVEEALPMTMAQEGPFFLEEDFPLIEEEAPLFLTLRLQGRAEEGLSLDSLSFVLKNSQERILGVREGDLVTFPLSYEEEGSHKYLFLLEPGDGAQDLTLREEVAFGVEVRREADGSLSAFVQGFVNGVPCEKEEGADAFFTVGRR